MTKLTVYLALTLFSSNFSSTTVAKDQLPQLVETHQSVQLVDEEQRFMDLVNSERWSRGLGTLKLDPTLVKVARNHSQEMHDKDYFDHFSPTNGRRTAMDRYLVELGHRPTWAYVGENLFYCSITDVNRGHTCLMDSPGHRENILNAKFDTVGVGIYKAENGEFWVTEMFLAKID